MHGLGRKVMRPLQGHQALVIQAAQRRQQAVLFKALKDIEKYRIESAGSERIEEGADLMITRNLRHTSQGLDVIVPVGVWQATLVCQKRGRWGEKDAKGPQSRILDGVSRLGTRLAIVRQWRSVSVQDAFEGIKV
jgi:hypothetical protein